METRCSSLPLIACCQAAAVPPKLRVERSSPEAEDGTAVHEALSDWIDDSVETELGTDEQRILYRLARKCWAEVEDYFPHAGAECYLEYTDPDWGVTLTGHADVLSVLPGDAQQPEEVRVLDFKTGRLDLDAEDQLRGYAWLALQEYPGSQIARAAIVRVREQTVDWFTWSRHDLEAWWHGLCARLLAEEPGYTPGVHCGYCKRWHECPAKSAMVRDTVFELCGVMLGGQIDGHGAGIIIDCCKILEKLCENGRAMVRAGVIEAGGRLETGDGRELLIEQQERRQIAFAPAWRIIGQTVQPNQYGDVFEVRKSALENAVRENAPRGQKAAAVQDLYRRLDEAGAMKTTFISRLEVRRAIPKPQQIGATHDSTGESTTTGAAAPATADGAAGPEPLGADPR